MRRGMMSKSDGVIDKALAGVNYYRVVIYRASRHANMSD